MFKKLCCLLLTFVFVFGLCGCDLFTADTADLLSPPSLSDDFKEISNAVKNSIDTDYVLEYPQSGKYRSAIVQNDVNGDGENEVFAFYSTKDGETEISSINAIFRIDGEWKSVAIQTMAASGVNVVDFCDFDRDGTNEILVGWQIYSTSEMMLAVYSYKNGELAQRVLTKYNQFAICDLDENNTKDILVIESDIERQKNAASLYGFSQDGVVQIGKCALDSKVQSFGAPIVSELSSGKAAVYIDAVKGIGAITEVLIYEKGKLLNPLHDAQTNETIKTLHSANLSTQDFNNDGVLEIPVQISVPSVVKTKASEKLYLTSWCSFNGELLTAQMTTMVDTADGYCFDLPSKWVGNIAVLKDTDNRIRTIYEYNAEKAKKGDELISFRAITIRDWENGIYKALGLMEIGRTDQFVIASKVLRKSGLTYQKAVKSFRVLKEETVNETGTDS